jgi:DNA-binding transcriptional LysR family regulator
MHTPSLLAIQAFTRVVEMNSFTAAARAMEMTGGAVSKLVAQLEADVGVRLLHRTTRSVRVSEEGQAFYTATLRMQEDLSAAIDEARRSTTSLTGRLKVSAPTSFALMWLSSRMPAFMAAHSQLVLDLTLSDSFVDLIAQDFDCAIRIASQLPDSGLVARRLGEVQRVLVASSGYLATAPQLNSPADLPNHRCLIYTQTSFPGEWAFQGTANGEPVTVNGQYRVNNSVMLRDALLAGQGLTLTPLFVVRDLLASGQLQELLPSHQPKNLLVHGVIAHQRYASRKVQVFFDFVAQQLAQSQIGDRLSESAEPVV